MCVVFSVEVETLALRVRVFHLTGKSLMCSANIRRCNTTKRVCYVT